MDVPPRTCRFFDPSAKEARESGLISGPDYPYDKHFGYARCGCPDYPQDLCVLGASAESAWDQCPYYEPEATTKLGLKRIDLGETVRYVALDCTRLARGVGEYRVVTWLAAPASDPGVVPPDASVIARLHTHDHPSQHRVLARELWTLKANGYAPEAGAVTDVKCETVPAHSYLDHVLTEVP